MLKFDRYFGVFYIFVKIYCLIRRIKMNKFFLFINNEGLK